MSESEDVNAQIAQLQQQQSLFTQSLVAMLNGLWTGAGSVEALTYALDPNIQGTLTLNPPVTQSEYTEPPKN